jgi:hypothetical protein
MGSSIITFWELPGGWWLDLPAHLLFFELFSAGRLEDFVALIERVEKFRAYLAAAYDKVFCFAIIVASNIQRVIYRAFAVFVDVSPLTFSGYDTCPSFFFALTESEHRRSSSFILMS